MGRGVAGGPFQRQPRAHRQRNDSLGVAADGRRARLAARERGRRERRRAVEEQAPRHPHVGVAGPERGRREEAAAVVRRGSDLGGARASASLKPRVQLRRGSRRVRVLSVALVVFFDIWRRDVLVREAEGGAQCQHF